MINDMKQYMRFYATVKMLPAGEFDANLSYLIRTSAQLFELHGHRN